MNKDALPALVAHKISKTVVLSNSSNKNAEADKKITIISDINLSINNGESVAIVGASGSGKSTLLGLLAGLDLPTTGKIEFYGTQIQKLDEEQRASIRRSDIGFIFQQFLLVPSLTAIENVMLPAELSDDAEIRQNARTNAANWLEKVGLSHRLDHFPNQLSGGEQQRVAIARAFITKPKLLFADEPSANLDSVNGHLVEDLLFDLNKSADTTLVLVTHDPALAKRCEKTFVLKDGSLKQQGEIKPRLAEVTNIEKAKQDAK
ncbi:ABC transporter ATP-binding protein [Psychrosphaera aestuarii]|uniref:ABC transporter ATP-binding protein n=1 Tax=Psychrosphaera aestuarii TaxID=1266052 RepID=UPI001B32329A|nr:ATP-binding cassette domain-containing protein [Psychrosphaera aestuarii]